MEAHFPLALLIIGVIGAFLYFIYFLKNLEFNAKISRRVCKSLFFSLICGLRVYAMAYLCFFFSIALRVSSYPSCAL